MIFKKRKFNQIRKKVLDKLNSKNMWDLIIENDKTPFSTPGGVYLIYNINTYQVYVGESTNVAKRIIQHGTVENPTQYIDLSIKKNGVKNFRVVFLAIEKNKKIRYEKEAYFVDLFNSYYNGYNNSIDGHPMSIKQRKKRKRNVKFYRKNFGILYSYIKILRKYRNIKKMERFFNEI